MAKKFGFFQIKSQNYDPVADEEESTFTDEKGLNTKPLGSNYRSLPWCITTFLFAGLAALFFVRNLQLTRHGSFETGYPSELVAKKMWQALASNAIQVSQIKFTGGIKFHDDGSMYRDATAPGPSYVGPPSPQLDAAWDQMIGTRYLAFTEKQKGSFHVEMDHSDKDGLYRAGPDVMHSLHCVDKLRRTIDGYLYQVSEVVDESPQNVMHLEHCIDFLRQLVACNSDLTPIPLVYSKGAGFAIPDFEQVHTCRNFEMIRQWAMRQNEDALSTVDSSSARSISQSINKH
ncbi:hypothetical protein N7527_011200 [Penicillium freii]|nr:hypothetical protein N7527_011200 [Penicillium freii]